MSRAIGTANGTFPRRLRALRKELGLSQYDVELLSGIPKPRLSRYENGHVGPSLATVEALALALEVRPSYLVGWDR